MWVTARYLWHKKWLFKCERVIYNVAQKVETLLVNRNENVAAVFSIFIEDHTKARIEKLGFTSVR